MRAGAEYRLDIDLSRRTNRVRIAVTAEIWAWERQEPTATPGHEAKRLLQSSRALEGAFLTTLANGLGRVSQGTGEGKGDQSKERQLWCPTIEVELHDNARSRSPNEAHS